MQSVKERYLHENVQQSDRYFFASPPYWMVWLMGIGSLALRVPVVLYDGSPLHDRGKTLLAIVHEESVTIWGASSVYLNAVAHQHLQRRLPDLHTILATGSPLFPATHSYLSRAFGHKVRVYSVSGGTEIASVHIHGSPLLPVYRGQTPCRSLAQPVEVCDDNGVIMHHGRGELVCTGPFLAMPLGFLRDLRGALYRDTYFKRFRGYWYQGDYAERDSAGSVTIIGRSDATLNRYGERRSPDEIYDALRHTGFVEDAIVVEVGYPRAQLLLFVRVKKGLELTSLRKQRINTEIAKRISRLYLPDCIHAVRTIPYTATDKKMEIPLKRFLSADAGISTPTDRAEIFKEYAPYVLKHHGTTL